MKKLVSILLFTTIMGTSVFANSFKPGDSIELSQNKIKINATEYNHNYKNYNKLESLVKEYLYNGSCLPLRDIIQLAKEIDKLIKD